MLKIEKDKDGNYTISGDQSDLVDLQYQLTEVMDHKMLMTKNYYDWDAKGLPIIQVTVKLDN